MAKPAKPDCYTYVRDVYKVPAYVGVKIAYRGRRGVIVAARSALHYVHIRFDDGSFNVVMHPTEDGLTYHP